MTNWQTKTIKDVASLIKDGTHGTHMDATAGIPLLSAKDINNGRVNVASDARLISLAEFKAIHKGYKLQDGDVLVTIVGSLGRVAMVSDYTDSYTFQRSVAILRFREYVVPQFAYYAFSSPYFQRELLKRESKGAQGGVYLGDIAKIKIQIPEKPEQERIVGVLKVWDEYIEKLEQKIALKEQLKKGLMQQLLTGKRRLPGFVDKWVGTTLGEISKVSMGQSPSSSSYNDTGNGLVLIQGNADMKNGCTIERIWTSEVTREAPEGSLIMTVRAPVGEIAVAAQSVCLGRGVCSINSDFSEYLRIYLSWFKPKWTQFIQGSTFESVNGSDIRELKLELPSLDEANKITEVISTVEKEIDILRSTKDSTGRQKKYLLKNLTSGTIRTPEGLKPLVQAGVQS